MEDAGPTVAAPEYVPRPQQMMGFTDAVKNTVKNNYIGFSGRASRSEFWWFVLFQNLVLFGGYIVVFGYIFAGLNEDGTVSVPGGEGAKMSAETFFNLIRMPMLLYLALLLPSLAVSVRRLHDVGRSGLWLLIGIIPLVNCIGGIVLLVWMIQDGNAHVNAFGAVPTNEVE